MIKQRKFWKIEAWDGTKLIFGKKILLGQITENSMKELLRSLTASLALTEDEIIGCYAKKKTKIYLSHLEVTYNHGGRYMLMCGSNPHVTASVIEENV